MVGGFVYGERLQRLIGEMTCRGYVPNFDFLFADKQKISFEKIGGSMRQRVSWDLYEIAEEDEESFLRRVLRFFE